MHKQILTIILIFSIITIFSSCDIVDNNSDGNESEEDNLTTTGILRRCNQPDCHPPAQNFSNIYCNASDVGTGFLWKYPGESSDVVIMFPGGVDWRYENVKMCTDPSCPNGGTLLSREGCNGGCLRISGMSIIPSNPFYLVVNEDSGRVLYWYICDAFQRWGNGIRQRPEYGGCAISGPYVAGCNGEVTYDTTTSTTTTTLY